MECELSKGCQIPKRKEKGAETGTFHSLKPTNHISYSFVFEEKMEEMVE